MKKILSICFLWAISCALWGQTRSGYGGDFNPDSPDNPKEPGLTLKYDFKVTAEKGGYVNCDPSGSQFTAGTNIYLNANPNVGYQFKCWMEKDSVISTSQWHYYTMPARDVELKAVFVFQPQVPNNPEVIPLDYRVTVEASPSYAGNVDCSREEVKVGSYTYVSASPYSGYKFAGWMLDGKQVSTDSYYHFEMESRNMHFIAMFEFNPDVPGNPSNNPNGSATYLLKYTIDGQVCHTEQLPEGAPITAIATPEKKGYTFSGWSAFPTVMPAHEVVISGSFIPNKYHVTYKVDGAVIHEEDVDYGTKLTPPEGEKKEGYTLTWMDLPDAMPDYDLVVEGTYVANTYSLTYIVDGQVYKNYEVVFATEITPEQEPVKEGHTFSGWSEIPETMPAEDVTVTGSFTINKYLVIFKIGDDVIASDSLAYGSPIVVPDAPEKEGHTFCGWGEVLQYVPAFNVTFVGGYTVNKYKVYYYVGDVLIHTEEVEYGAAIPTYEYEPNNGDIIDGWDGEHYDTMPAHDVTYIANIISSVSLLYGDDRKLVVYDLNGRRIYDLDRLKSGLYIVNGKRALVK